MEPVPVSCIVTAYNNARTIRGAIGSVLAQSRPVAEIVVADDASTDETPDIIREIAQAHPRVRPILRSENIGVAANRDLAIRAAGQPFVTHLDGDDALCSGKIAAEWRAIGGSPRKIGFSRIVAMRPGQFWRGKLLDPRRGLEGPLEERLGNLMARSHPVPRDMLFSKELFLSVGGFAHDLGLFEDWHLKLRLAASGAEWCDSGAVGTLYMQWGTGLSTTDGERLSRARAEVLSRLGPDLIPIVGADCVEEALAQAKRGAEAMRRNNRRARREFLMNVPTIYRAYRMMGA